MTNKNELSFYEKQTMTVLDHYAALILAGLIANEGIDPGPASTDEYGRLVVAAFEIADRCIIERCEYGLEK